MGRHVGPPPVDARIAAAAGGDRHGVFSLAELGVLGLGSRGAQHRAAAGRLHRLHAGVYAVMPPSLLSVRGRWRAAVLACGHGSVLSHRDAAALHGFRPSARARIDVTVPRSGRRSPGGVQLHRTRRLGAGEATVVDGIPVTTVARTLVDVAAVLDDDAIARAVNEAEVLRLLDVVAVEASLALANGCSGTAALRAAIAAPGAGSTRSELERRFAGLCRRAGLPLPRLNATVDVGDRLIEVDALWSRARFVVELDGADVHATRRAFHADRRRDAALASEGYVVVRLTWERVTSDAAAVGAELRRVLAHRGGST